MENIELVETDKVKEFVGEYKPQHFLLIMPDYRCQLMKLVKLPRYFCGVAAQFFYVGVQIAVWTWTIREPVTPYIMQKVNTKLRLVRNLKS